MIKLKKLQKQCDLHLFLQLFIYTLKQFKLTVVKSIFR